ncbi:DUF3310 domain-containing protein [Limosilactobacillus fermentum]
MKELIRPNYYKDENGTDLFHQFEHGPMPIDAGIAFCYMNICKYLQRAGKKTQDPSEDIKKVWTYFYEYKKLIEIKHEGGGEQDKDLMNMIFGEVSNIDEYLSIMIDSLESKVADIKRIYEEDE